VQYHKVYGTEIIPSVGLAYAFSQSTSVKASVSKGYRSPTIRELFIKQWGANPDLKPENVMNYEAGIIQSFFDRKLCLELTGFFIEGDNLITTVPGKGMMNTGKIENKGIEFAAKANPVKLFYIDAAYSFISMKQPVFATPEHQLYVGTRYSMNKVTCMLSMQWVHNLDTEVSAKTALVSYSLVNAKVMFRFAKFASMFVSAENVFDQKYAINRYYTMPGITFFSGLNLNFE
jgi:iron complex outermembrane receptor protein